MDSLRQGNGLLGVDFETFCPVSIGSGGDGSECSVTGHRWGDNRGLGGCDDVERFSFGLCGCGSDIVSRS